MYYFIFSLDQIQPKHWFPFVNGLSNLRDSSIFLFKLMTSIVMKSVPLGCLIWLKFYLYLAFSTLLMLLFDYHCLHRCSPDRQPGLIELIRLMKGPTFCHFTTWHLIIYLKWVLVLLLQVEWRYSGVWNEVTLAQILPAHHFHEHFVIRQTIR